MTTAYTNLLGLALPVDGELDGTWGDTVNDYITQYLDAAIAGAQVISGGQTAVTLSKTTNASLSQAGTGATGSSQYQIINCTGNPATLLTITAPAASKVYLILNNTSNNQSVKIVGTGPTTGVTVAAGRNALVAWNGSDFELVATTDAATLSGILPVANGGTGQASYAVGDLLYASSSTALAKLADVATGNALLSGGVGVAPVYGKVGLTTHVTGTLPVASGGTGQSSLTANNVLLGNGTSAVAFVAPGASGNMLTSDGTTWVSANTLSNGTYTPSIADVSKVDISGSTAYPFQYMRVGEVVTVSGKVDIALTTTGVCQMSLTLPVASTFTDSGQCAGFGEALAAGFIPPPALRGIVVGSSTKALFQWYASVTGAAQTYYFHFTYRVV